MEGPSDAKKPLSKKNREAFAAISSFVSDLWDVFGNPKKADSLALYHRLIENIKFSDVDTIEKVIAGFQIFINDYNASINSNKLDSIPKGIVITYGKTQKICLEVQKFIYKTKDDPETRDAIRSHLLKISCILEPNSDKLAELEKFAKRGLNIDTSTAEGRFINGIMEKAKNSMTDVDTNNPMQAMASIFQSGVVQDMIQGFQQGVSSGEMKVERLLGTMQSAIGSVMPVSDVPESTNEEEHEE
jgi:hypothetical protein